MLLYQNVNVSFGCFAEMETGMLGNTLVTKSTGLEYTTSLMVTVMRDRGMKAVSKDMECTHSEMVILGVVNGTVVISRHL